MRFFNPNHQFLVLLSQYAGRRPVFDIGCGDGHVTLALRKLGARVLGIDPRYRYEEVRPVELAACVLPFPAQECPILRNTPNSLALFCRPCHNGFVLETLRVLHPTSEALYIGLPVNLDLDLPEQPIKLLATPPSGQEKEKAWRILR
jgi:SAM-dependent methyltransferase